MRFAFLLSAFGIILFAGNAHAAGIKKIKYLGNYPKHRNSGWSWKLQGVANDRANWFFTQEKRLWKFPIRHDLKKKVTKPNRRKGILATGMPRKLKGYNHFGDLDYYKGYLFVPTEGGNRTPVIAVFRARDLKFIDAKRLYIRRRKNGRVVSERMTRSGWAAIHPKTGILYTSHNRVNRKYPVYKFRIDHNLLRTKGKLKLTYIGYLRLKKQNKLLSMHKYMQGGVFSGDGRYLFLVNGTAARMKERKGGVWVFHSHSGNMIMKSRTKGKDFRYQFHTGFPKFEEPEGITWWNLDRRNAPKIKGQLHVILLDNDGAYTPFYLKHYRVYNR